jgi:hypothetical protein
MGIREKLRDKPALATAIAAGFVLLAIVITVKVLWPEKKAQLEQAFYTDDDGATWFSDSIYRATPFDHNGKSAVVAQIYTYDDGKKQFCAYLSRFTPDAKAQLQAALDAAQRRGQRPGSVGLYQDRDFMSRSVEVKKPGANEAWVPFNDPRAKGIFAVHSPDGSAVDQAYVY